ncbi:amino acid ABC transporter permease [Flaviflagellibacter deserti]|uniref:Amino acid ABC transporter permease n=1 Tax=Flaviflagellibacter deserti TaxID=2267266 RepID=A0ABV9Z4D2_9HYPH
MIDFTAIAEYAPAIGRGLLVTIEICAVSLVLGLLLGLGVALLARLPWLPLRWLIRSYIELWRGTPLLLQLFILYYGGPTFGFLPTSYQAGVLGMSLYTAAYLAEIFRAGFEAVPPGQVEAARMLGFTKLKIVRHIELPQMLRLVVPPTTNQMISIIKESAVLSVITVPELTLTTTRIVSETFVVVEPYLLLGLAYWSVTAMVAFGSRQIERRLVRA